MKISLYENIWTSLINLNRLVHVQIVTADREEVICKKKFLFVRIFIKTGKSSFLRYVFIYNICICMIM